MKSSSQIQLVEEDNIDSIVSVVGSYEEFVCQFITSFSLFLGCQPSPLRSLLSDGKGFERDTTGFGVSFDQAITEKTGAFFRYGWDDSRVRTFSNYWSLGGTLKGPTPAREKDVLGFGLGQGITHQDYRRANNATHTETIFEAYYKIHMTDWYSITLDIQTLLNPGTNSHNDTSVIPGIRLKMLF